MSAEPLATPELTGILTSFRPQEQLFKSAQSKGPLLWTEYVAPYIMLVKFVQYRQMIYSVKCFAEIQ